METYPLQSDAETGILPDFPGFYVYLYTDCDFCFFLQSRVETNPAYRFSREDAEGACSRKIKKRAVPLRERELPFSLFRMFLETGICAVNDDIRTGHEAAGVACQIDTDGFQFFRGSHASAGGELFPLGDQRLQLRGCLDQICADVAGADAVDAYS